MTSAERHSVGDQIDDQTLPDADGRPTSLAELASHGRLIVLLYRGHW